MHTHNFCFCQAAIKKKKKKKVVAIIAAFEGGPSAVSDGTERCDGFETETCVITAPTAIIIPITASMLSAAMNAATLTVL